MSTYQASRLFPPIYGAACERRATDLLTRLYVHRRDHYGREPRRAEAFSGDLAWFTRWVPPTAEVLDCGAGTGSFAALLARRGYRVTAADRYGPEDLDRLKDVYSDLPSMDLVDVETLVESGRRFDALVSINVLEHLVRPDETLLAWRRMIRPGGTLSIVCPNYSGVLSPLRILVSSLRGGSRWRYRSPWAALAHASENLLLDMRQVLSRRPGFVRCMPQTRDEDVYMDDADLDTVHLPSARGLKRFLELHGMKVLNWGTGAGRGALGRMIDRLLPAWSPTVRIHAVRT